ncbi:hypothetical protein [Streptomyces sp. NPDC090298]|uniref:hypothetical protein n=1 Tax=Streptomyces sp. NPDC090298 TaxID=3365959 RepID=UPI00380FAC79
MEAIVAGMEAIVAGYGPIAARCTKSGAVALPRIAGALGTTEKAAGSRLTHHTCLGGRTAVNGTVPAGACAL